MECNREEARRARDAAKKKFLAKDVSAARKFAQKAQMLCPELEGISQMLATIDVHLSAQNIINGEIDYYSVLGLKPEADDGTVRKQYRKMAVMLHPDKNKSVGAEEAFKYLSQAWGVFSDKAKRAEYDQKRNVGMYEKSSTLGGTSSLANPAVTNGLRKVTKVSGSTSKVKNSKRGTNRAGDASAASSSREKIADGTFWTVCRSCRTQYEYHRVYLNQNLLCPNCRNPFIAVETAPPGSGSIRKSFHEHQFNSIHQATGRKKNASVRDNGVYGDYDSYGHANYQWGVYSGTQNAAGQTGPRRDEGVRRKYTKRVGGGSSTTSAPKRRRGLENTGASGITSAGVATKSDSAKEYTEQELQSLFKRKAMQEICRQLQETHRGNDSGTAAKRRKIDGEENNGRIENSSESGNACERSNGVSESGLVDSIHCTSGVEKDSKFSEALMVDVPDPDFCDFDKDRTEMSFSDNQIWAAYDSFDGMPRSYAVIHNVFSLDPFKLRISWLAWETKGELSSLKWLGSGISKTCGEFRAGKPGICRSPYLFSHKVKWTKGDDGQFRIYPRKGDVWALYRNWSPDWNYLAGGETIMYDIVEVLEGYTEEYGGVSVVPLVKVAGFKAVFHHHLDSREVRTIPREEISRFSHRIPSILLTGREAPAAPKGCIQLDPAATPSDFLRVISHREAEDDPMEEEPSKEEGVVKYIDLDGREEKVDEETVDILTGTPLKEKDEDNG
ncbi:PREDICTED: uncharacterized protein LOC104825495 [Tarenaya hassleriana]|uniref:uncharacterized protein LOC104825495 n=1 Tax=Tarenaya hassleriana TaxID=28532 RepID=UPI00053C94DE|nr:PREDICTED: uncharacterized protein LOC104825495 [Tarenaya hassleriana]